MSNPSTSQGDSTLTGLAFRGTFLLCSAFWHVSHILIWRGKRGIRAFGNALTDPVRLRLHRLWRGETHTAGLSGFLSPNKNKEAEEKKRTKHNRLTHLTFHKAHLTAFSDTITNFLNMAYS